MSGGPTRAPGDRALARHWTLRDDVTYLNHGAFGACPRRVLDAQAEVRRAIEEGPVDFFTRRLFDRTDTARARLATFVGADPDGLVPVANATTGVNTVLRSLAFEAGDELVVTDHAYNACRNALDFVAERTGARVVVARVPFPLADPEEVTRAVLAAVGTRTRLALVDHVTSPTGLVFPVAAIVSELAERGVDTLVDGAHAPGMVPLDLEALGAAYYTGNCHKWMCAPKGAGFLSIRADRRDAIRPLVISHGVNYRRAGRSLLHDLFDWVGTVDPSAFLSVPAAIDAMAGMLDGGWPAVMARNRATALAGRTEVTSALGLSAPCPDAMVGSLATLALPGAAPPREPGMLAGHPLQERLYSGHGIEVPVFSWPERPHTVIRLSAQLYNEPADYATLADALRAETGAG